MGFTLITTLYSEQNEHRIKEYLHCLERNLNNQHVDEIVILYEKKKNDDLFLGVLEKKNVKIVHINRRPTFRFIFEYTNRELPDKKIVVLNADIYFSISRGLNLMDTVDLSDRFIVLTRYNKVEYIEHLGKTIGVEIKDEGIKLRSQHKLGYSIDCWIYRTPLKITFRCDYLLGTNRCDSCLNFQLKYFSDYTVYNPCLDIISIHEHKGWDPNKYNFVVDADGKRYHINEWNRKLRKEKNRWDFIRFCKLDDIK